MMHIDDAELATGCEARTERERHGEGFERSIGEWCD